MAEEKALYYTAQSLGGGRVANTTVWRLSEDERATLAGGGQIYITQITNGEQVPTALSTIGAEGIASEFTHLQDLERRLADKLIRLSVELSAANWHKAIGLRWRIKKTRIALAECQYRLGHIQEVWPWLTNE